MTINLKVCNTAIVQLIIMVCLIGVSTSYSQISIQVKDVDSDEPIPFAHIYILDGPDVILTDENGEASIESDSDSILISHIAYHKKRFNLLKGNVFYLNSLNYKLDEVTVKAKRIDKKKIFEKLIQLLQQIRSNTQANKHNSYIELYTIRNQQIVEEMKAYYLLRQNDERTYKKEAYINGQFKINPTQTFLNLETDEFVLSFSDVGQYKGDVAHYLNKRKFKYKDVKEGFFIRSDEGKRAVRFRYANQTYTFHLDDKMENLISLMVNYEKPQFKFFGLQSKVVVSKFAIKYNYKQNQVSSIESEINYLSDQLPQQTYINVYFQSLLPANYAHIVAGEYKEDNVYEHIIVNPLNPYNHHFKSSIQSPTLPLDQAVIYAQPSIEVDLLDAMQSSNYIHFYNSPTIDFTPFAIGQFRSIDPFSLSKINNNNKLKFFWYFTLDTSNNLKIISQKTIVSDRSEIVKEKSDFLTNIKGQFASYWAEHERIKFLKSIQQEKPTEIAELKNKIRIAYQKTNADISTFLNQWDFNDYSFLKEFKDRNDTIQKYFKLDFIATIIQEEAYLPYDQNSPKLIEYLRYWAQEKRDEELLIYVDRLEGIR